MSYGIEAELIIRKSSLKMFPEISSRLKKIDQKEAQCVFFNR